MIVILYLKLVDLYFCKCAGRPNLQKACVVNVFNRSIVKFYSGL
jgi:hypothetical protein